MKIIRLPELHCWAAVEFPEDDLPTILDLFHTEREAKEYKAGNKPSLLSKVKLYFERH